jgi:hypothetical protein
MTIEPLTQDALLSTRLKVTMLKEVLLWVTEWRHGLLPSREAQRASDPKAKCLIKHLPCI